MNKKKLWVVLSLTLVTLLVFGGVALAQTATPTTPQAGAKQAAGTSGGWNPFKGGWKIFDAVANVLKLTPTQFFEQLHSGKKLADIAQAQGVEMQAVKDAAKQARQATAQQKIQQALDNGKITADQAEWMRQGLAKGWRWPAVLGKVQRLLRNR